MLNVRFEFNYNLTAMWSYCSKCCDRSADKRLKRGNDNNVQQHLYCGCSQSRKQRKAMAQKSADIDKQTLIDSDVEEAADYDFVNATKYEEFLVYNPVSRPQSFKNSFRFGFQVAK